MAVSTSDPNKQPEQRARANIDAALVEAGWVVQSRDEMNVAAGPGVAIREFATDVGRADYLLYVDKKPAGVIEAKREDKDRIRRILVPMPPQAERERISSEVERRLSVLDALDRTLRQNLFRCAHLRQSILKRAFSGKLVPQDPTDEPASALLARIHAQPASR